MVKSAWLPCGRGADVQRCQSQESLGNALGVTIHSPVNFLQFNVPSRTWVLTSEPVLEPPELLKKECEKAGLGPDDFLSPALGETVRF